MIRTLSLIACVSFVIAALCLGGAAALAGPDLAKSDFWREFDWRGGAFRHDARFDPDAPVTTQVRDLAGFTRVDVGGGLHANVTVGPDFKVEVVGAAPDLVTTQLNGTELEIHPQRRAWWRGLPHARVNVTLPALEGVSSSAGANVDVAGVNGGDLTLDASAGASLDASGACAAIDAEASSGARIDADELVCTSGSVEASSGASVKVHVTGALDIEASSGGSIQAAGNPQLGRVDLSSGGSLDRD